MINAERPGSELLEKVKHIARINVGVCNDRQNLPQVRRLVQNRIRYIYGCTKHDHEITGIRTIDSNCTSSDPSPVSSLETKPTSRK